MCHAVILILLAVMGKRPGIVSRSPVLVNGYPNAFCTELIGARILAGLPSIGYSRWMKPTLKKPQRVHQNPFMNIDHVAADFGTFHKDYYIVEFGPRAGILPLREGKVLLVSQYRLLPDTVCWEIPGGKVEAGEDPAIAATRECAEEAGVHCSDLHPILTYYPGLDNVQNRTSLFYSETVTDMENFTVQKEEIEDIGWFPVDLALGMVFDGQIQDAMSVTGLLGYSALANKVRP
jgi:8-oxo-dGTP pyrophosphatase MutT (NUDIX family)